MIEHYSDKKHHPKVYFWRISGVERNLEVNRGEMLSEGGEFLIPQPWQRHSTAGSRPVSA